MNIADKSEVSGEDDDEEADVDASADADAVAEPGVPEQQNEDENNDLNRIIVVRRNYLPREPIPKTTLTHRMLPWNEHMPLNGMAIRHLIWLC